MNKDKYNAEVLKVEMNIKNLKFLLGFTPLKDKGPGIEKLNVEKAKLASLKQTKNEIQQHVNKLRKRRLVMMDI